jgi:HlyD family secretion protein
MGHHSTGGGPGKDAALAPNDIINRLNPPRLPRSLVAVFALALALSLAGCSKLGRDEKKEEEQAKEVPLVRVASLKRLTLDRNLEITGAVEAMTYVTVNPRLEDAEILELKADVGDRVDAGAVLAVFDATDAKLFQDDAKVAQAEAAVQLKDAEVALRELQSQVRGQKLSLDQAQKTLDRGKAQAEKGAIAKELLETLEYKRDQETAMAERLALQVEKAAVAVELAKTSREKADLMLVRADRKVAWATLRAPIAGIVAKRQATVGQQTLFTSLARGALFEIFDPGSLVVNAQVTQRDLPYVRIGLPVEIRSDACPGTTFAGSVSIVSPVIDATTGTVPIRIAIKDHERLKPGFFVSGRIVLEARPNTLVVPKKAVLYERERPYVMKLVAAGDQSKVSRVFFREGLSGKEEVEVVTEDGAIGETDQIVLVGHDRLRDGDPVKVEKPAEGTAEGATSRAAGPANGG